MAGQNDQNTSRGNSGNKGKDTQRVYPACHDDDDDDDGVLHIHMYVYMYV